MPNQDYTYNIVDTLYDLVSPDWIKKEIETSSITIALESPFPVAIGDTTFTVTFKDSLSEGEEETLGLIVANHNGSLLPALEPREVKFYGSSDL